MARRIGPRLRWLVPALLAACATPPSVEPWMRDGEVVGTLRVIPVGEDLVLSYSDRAGLLRRTEVCDAHRRPRPGVPACERDYDERQRLTEVRYVDGGGRLTNGPDGTAVQRVEYRSDGDTRVELRTFADAERQPHATRGGFAYVIARFRGELILSLEFRDVNARPAAASVDGVVDVHRVEFAHLVGLDAVLAAAYLDRYGVVRARRRISGRVGSLEEHSSSTSTLGTVQTTYTTSSYSEW